MEGIKDYSDMYDIICRIIEEKVDRKYVEEWAPAKIFDFLKRARLILKSNKSEAKETERKLRKKLIEEPLFLEAAYIAKDVYLPNEGDLLGGWHRSNDFSDLEYRNSAGLVSCLYSRNTQGDKEYIYATAGTNPKNIDDWKANLEQLYGGSMQYAASLRIAQELNKRIDGKCKLTFVGHSLGGGLASNNAIQTGLEAIVFNPASLSAETINSDMNTLKTDNIKVFLSYNDILNWFQDTSAEFPGMSKVIPSSLGERYYLYNKVFLFKSHTIEQMIINMNKLLE